MEYFDSYAKAKRALNINGGFLLALLDGIYMVCDYEIAFDMRNPPPDEFATAEEYLASLAPHFDETKA